MAKTQKNTQALRPSWSGATPGSIRGKQSKRVHHMLCMNDRCIPYDESNFTENINWRIFRIMAEFVEGFEFLSRLKNEVSIYGSARAAQSSKYYQIARDLGYKLGKSGYTVITGGGPGIMEGANRGAYESGGESIGLDIMLPMEQRENQYVKRSLAFHYFFTRKVMLSASSQAYIIFPGGFGTLDEMFEVVTLIQTGKTDTTVPVILVGKNYWAPLMAWMKEMMCEEERFIDAKDLKIFHIVDTAEEAFAIVKKTHERPL